MGDLNIEYPKPYSIYLRGAIGSFGGLGFRDCFGWRHSRFLPTLRVVTGVEVSLGVLNTHGGFPKLGVPW